MKVKITKIPLKKKTEYQADLLDLPGIPWIGRGFTPQEAVVTLFYRILHDPVVDWRKYIDFSKIEIEEKDYVPIGNLDAGVWEAER